MQTIQFMREKDINAISENINSIKEKARKQEIELIEPTLNEFTKVRNIILSYIKQEKRIIYGGYAWNTLIKSVEPSKVFYKDTDYSDVEFYSNKPIQDLINLCNLIYDAGYKFVQGKNAQHPDTYTVFVNFTGYCDITYMPSNLFNTVMTKTINEIKFIHPKFIMVDILRQYTDPMTSYWRIDNTIKRGKLIMEYFNLELSSTKRNYSPILDESIKILYYILPLIIELQTILFIGAIAYNQYIYPDKSPIKYTNNCIEIISTRFRHDVKYIYKIISNYYEKFSSINKFQDEIIYEQYYPFFQFIDDKAVFKFGDQPFIIIYKNNEKCIPYNKINFSLNKKQYNIKIGTFNVIFMYFLSGFHQAIADKNINIQRTYDYLMYNMLTVRNTYLDKHNKNVLDDTIYQDFKIDCLGEPISPKRKYLLMMQDRKLLPNSYINLYDPAQMKNDYKIDSYNFANYSGNIVNNPKHTVFHSKHV